MLQQHRKSFKLLHPSLFLAISCRFRFSHIIHSISCPSISFSRSFPRFLHNAAKPISSLDLKLHLPRQEDAFSSSQVKSLLDDRYFLAVSLDRIDSLLSFLRAKGIPNAVVSRLLTRNPSIFRFKVESLETKFKYLEDLGMEMLGLQKLLKSPYVMTVLGTSIKTLQKHVEFLQRIGLSKRDILTAAERYPRVLCVNADGKMNDTLVFFEYHGLSKKAFARLVRAKPHVFGLSIERSLTTKMKFLRDLGLDIRSKHGERALISWLSCSRERLISGFGSLKNEGFSEADVYKLMVQQPQILMCRADSVKRRIDYIKNVLNRDLQEVVKYPPCLCLSLENRIIPRFTFLNELEERGKYKTALSLSTLLAISDEDFARRYGTDYAKWKAGYLSKDAEARRTNGSAVQSTRCFPSKA